MHELTRRDLIAALAATAALGVGCGATEPAMTRLPALFIGHGAPTAALDAVKAAPWRAWGEALPRPSAILVISAHWEAAPATIGATRTVPLIYDFSGFPRPLYELTYAAPGAPDLADRVAALLPGARRDEARGLDHGAWVPLLHLFPSAEVPVLQVSIPSRDPAAVLAFGRALAPLRDEGVLIVGSGNLTHNLRAIAPEGRPPEAWAAEFDAWATAALAAGDVAALVDAPARAPAYRLNHPTPDHWLPLLAALGAGGGDPVRFPVEGWEFGNLSRRSVQLG